MITQYCMKKPILISFALVLFATTIIAQTPIFEWAVSMGGTTTDQGLSITTDALGNVLTTGIFSGTVDFDPGTGTLNLTSNGYFVQKLDPNGNLIWAKSMWGSGSSITTDAGDNVYTTGKFGGVGDFDPGPDTLNLTSAGLSDIFIQKLDSSGNLLWAISMGGVSYDYGYSITTDALGNVYTTGTFRGTVDFDPSTDTLYLTSNGSDDIFIQKLDSNGNLIWAKSMGGNSSDLGNSITTDALGNVLTTGQFYDTVDFDPSTDTLYLTSNGYADIFIQKLDSNGILIWAKSMGRNSGDLGTSITTDALGNVYTTGYFQSIVDFDPGPDTLYLTSAGGGDIFIQKLDPNGNLLWVVSMGGWPFEQANFITTDELGNVYTTGYFNGTVDFDPGSGTLNLTSAGGDDIFIQKLDSNGNLIWAISMGGATWGNGLYDEGNSITTDALGNVYTTGYFNGTGDFAPGVGAFNLTSAGFDDIFIQKLSQCFDSYNTDFQTACDSYTWIDGNTYSFSNNTATHTLTNAAGCDSVVTLNLTINNSTTGTDVQTACDSYVWMDGNTYTTSNNLATYTLTNAAGCDSVVTLNLTINNNTGIDNQTACDSYTWIDGNTYTSNNSTVTHTLINLAGCDSVVTLNLTINTVDTTVTQNGINLSANQTGASYQWLECPAMTLISGATSQSYTATANGDYAVIVSHNGCVDTSTCYTISTIGIIENDFGNKFLFYPNPSNGNFTIDLGNTYVSITIKLTDLNGKLIETNSYKNTQLMHLKIEEPVGIYLLNIETVSKKAIIKLIKE